MVLKGQIIVNHLECKGCWKKCRKVLARFSRIKIEDISYFYSTVGIGYLFPSILMTY